LNSLNLSISTRDSLTVFDSDISLDDEVEEKEDEELEEDYRVVFLTFYIEFN